MKQFLTVFSQRFKLLRIERAMSQQAFAEFLSISRPSVGFYEAGKRQPDAETVALICEKCGVSADWLLGLSEAKAPNLTDQAVARTLGLSPASARWLNRELSESMKGDPLFNGPTTAAFFNFAAGSFPNALGEIEAATRAAIYSESFNTDEQNKRLQDFLSSKEEGPLAMRTALLSVGADVISCAERREVMLDSASRSFRALLRAFVIEKGTLLQDEASALVKGGVSNGIDETENN